MLSNSSDNLWPPVYIRANAKRSRSITEISSYSSNLSHVIQNYYFALPVPLSGLHVTSNNEVTVNKPVVPFIKAWSWYNRSCSFSSAAIEILKRSERPALENFLIRPPIREHASLNFSKTTDRITFHVTYLKKKSLVFGGITICVTFLVYKLFTGVNICYGFPKRKRNFIRLYSSSVAPKYLLTETHPVITTFLSFP